MYRSCIFCSADLKANDALERFPVGRSIAFDSAKGRLWAVCPKCARWNLAPLEERWEAIEDAERLFRDTRTRVQRESIGLARLPDGTRLVRVGPALPGELAAWRYGGQLISRKRRYLLTGLGVAGASAAALAGAMAVGVGIGAWAGYRWIVRPMWRGYRDAEVLYTRGLDGQPGARLHLRRRHLPWTRLQPGADGRGIELYVPQVVVEVPGLAPGTLRAVDLRPLVVPDGVAPAVLGRAMVAVNARGARGQELHLALRLLEHARTADGYLSSAARQHLRLHGGSEVADNDPARRNPIAALALEMALHEETERRALEGELAMLEAMWRQAEEIASIADRLPDDVASTGAPRA